MLDSSISDIIIIMNSDRIKKAKKDLKLTKFQREVLVGLLLGDGHLETQDNGRTYRLKIEYGEKQKDYAFWVWEVFKNWTNMSSPKIKVRKSKLGKVNKSYYFNTYSHGAFRFYAHQFYPKNGGKKIPNIIHKLITPVSLAVWFMDDGSLKSTKHKTYHIAANSRSKSELKLIQKVLEDKFNVRITLHRQYDNWRIYIKTESAKKFKETIADYIIPSMKYKLSNNMPKK